MRSSLGCIRRLGKDYYEVSIEGKPTDDGRRHRAYKKVRGSRKDAEMALAKLKLDEGKYDADDRTLAEYWNVFYEPTLSRLAPSTQASYRNAWESMVEPMFGEDNMGDLKARDIEARLATIEKAGSQRNAFKLMRQMYNEAYRDEMIDENPFLRKIRLKRMESYEPEVLLLDEVPGWLEVISGSKYEPVLLLMLFCGLRREEACALDWQDVDDINVDGKRYAALRVHRTAVSINGALIMQESTKTVSSVRTVLLGAPFAPLLLGLRSDGALVPSINGRTSPSTIAHNWRLWCQRHDVPYVPLGQMRSVYATLACECVDSSLVSLVLGHTDGTTRGRNYQQATLHGMAIVADAYGALFLGQNWDNNYLNWDKILVISR